MRKQKIESTITETKKNEDFQEDNWNFLNDIESLINQSYTKKVLCLI